MTNTVSHDVPSPGVHTNLPLKGKKVIEFCHVVMGPSCGLILAELGADVIKVEPAPLGDRTRKLEGHVAGSFVYFNRSKRAIGLNLKTEGGRKVAQRLLQDADVLTENFAPGTADKLGIGYETVSKLNPRLIYCSLKGYLPGPYENYAALDEVVQYSTGLAYMTGLPDRPMRAGSSVVDIAGGMFGVIGILSALLQRDLTGRGRHVQSALFESSAFLVGQHIASEAHTGVAPRPFSVQPRSWGIYETFNTRDGATIFVGITSDKQWQIFCEIYERPDLFAEMKFYSNEKRRENHDELYAICQEVFLGYDAEPLIEMLVTAGLPAAPVGHPRDLQHDSQMNYEDRMSATRFASGMTAKLPRPGVSFKGVTEHTSGQAPQLGEHTDAVLDGAGFSPQEIAALREARDIV